MFAPYVVVVTKSIQIEGWHYVQKESINHGI